MGKYRRKSLNQQTIIKQYNITNNNYYINNEDINSNDINSDNEEKILNNKKDNTQGKDSSSEEQNEYQNCKDEKEKRKRFKANITAILWTTLSLLLYAALFTIVSFDKSINSSVSYSMLLVMFSLSITLGSEIREWGIFAILVNNYKNKKNNLLIKICTETPFLLFAIIIFAFSTVFLKENIKCFNTCSSNIISAFMLIIYLISYLIRIILTQHVNYKNS